MRKQIVILNEQHQLKAEQERILIERMDFVIHHIPRGGLTLDEMKREVSELRERLLAGDDIVFASPVPYMLKELAFLAGNAPYFHGKVLVFHNDRREKKDLPNGKVIFTVTEEGWQLV